MITININFLAFVTCIIFFIGLLLLILYVKINVIAVMTEARLVSLLSLNFGAYLILKIATIVYVVIEAIALFALTVAFSLAIIVFAVTEAMGSYVLMIEFISLWILSIILLFSLKLD
jgi:hypothetical protein